MLNPFDIIIFGGGGDLALRKLLPAMYRAYQEGNLPEGSRILPTVREESKRADAVTFGTGTFTGASSGDLTITPSAVNTGALTITNATNSGGTARNIYQSTSAPGGSDGAVGDLWVLYS